MEVEVDWKIVVAFLEDDTVLVTWVDVGVDELSLSSADPPRELDVTSRPVTAGEVRTV